MKSIIVTTAFFLTAFTGAKDKLTGSWQTNPSPKGNVTTVYFKEDNSFEGFINKKPFTTGRYTLEDDIFTFSDNGCNNATGIYRIIFFNNEDSLRLEVVADTCTGRREGMTKLVLGRIKN